MPEDVLDDIEVDVPDYGTVHFPGDMDHDAIRGVLARKFGPRKPMETPSPIRGNMGPATVGPDGYTVSGLESAPLMLGGKPVPTVEGSARADQTGSGFALPQEISGGINTTLGEALTSLAKESSKPAPKVLLPGYRNGEWQGWDVANQDKADQAKAEKKAFDESSLRISGKYLSETGKWMESPTPTLPEKVARMAGTFAPVVMSGGAAPLMIAAQTEGATIDANYEKYKKEGASDEDALARAVEDGQKAGLTQGMIWAVLPKPLQTLVGKATGKVGGGAVAQFVVKRAEGAATGGALGAASQAGANIAAGEPVGQNVLPAAGGMAILGALTPHGKQQEVSDARSEQPKTAATGESPGPVPSKTSSETKLPAGEAPGSQAKGAGGDVPLTPSAPEDFAPKNLTGSTPYGGTRIISKDWFAKLGDRMAEPGTWTEIMEANRANKISWQDTATQLAVHLRELGPEKAVPVIRALQEADAAMTAKLKAMSAEAKANPEKMMEIFTEAGTYAGVKQLPREAWEFATEPARETQGGLITGVPNEGYPPPLPKELLAAGTQIAEEQPRAAALPQPAPAQPGGAGAAAGTEPAGATGETPLAATGGEVGRGQGTGPVEPIGVQPVPGDAASAQRAATGATGEGIPGAGTEPGAGRAAGTPPGAIGAGPGAATRGVASEGAAEGNPDVYGIAARVREERAKAGQVIDVPPGEGIAPKDSVEHGRELLASGTDAEAVLAEFEKTKRLSADDMAVVRARGEQLAFEARRTEEKFGTDSPQYQKAWEDLSEWDARTKPMQTEWHKTGQAQQGETDIDTGTFTGLQRAHREATGKDFTPSQARKAKATAAKVTTAQSELTEARTKLNEELKSKPKTQADEKALEAANKTVRDAAARTAQAEAKALTKTGELKAAQDRVARKAEEAAKAAADKAVRNAAARLAAKERKGNVAEGARKTEADKIAREADQKALDAAAKTVREAAVRRVAAEHKAELKAAQLAKEAADVELQAAKKAEAAVQKVHRDAAAAAAKAEQARLADPARTVWDKIRDYIEQGMDDYDDIRHKVATDLGMKVDDVTKLIGQTERTKRLADNVWAKQQVARRVKEQARRWLTNIEVPGYQKALQFIPRAMFSLKVGFHGTVALGTHAPMVAFQPRFWETYVKDFAKMYKLVGSPKFYEKEVQDLLRRPNYTTARRAGLVNDPFVFEDYTSPQTAAYFGNLSGMGNRGYTILKILRQDMFDQMWSKLPRTQQIPEVAKAIADGLNHATGVVKGRAPAGANVALFAPRLMASRVMWLAGDPIKAVDTFARWKNAGPGEKVFAINQVKEKAWVLGTAFTLLAINQGILSAMGSKQKVNMTDPMKSDFMKFKVAGETFSYGNAMLTMARLPLRLYEIRASKGGKLKNVVYPDEDSYSVLGEYLRSQESPFASLMSDLWFRSDWMRRNLPNSNRPMPARLRRQHVKPYTWAEFWTEKALPIPAEEAAREVWKHGLGMSDEQVKSLFKASATIAIMGATGARLTEDYDVKEK